VTRFAVTRHRLTLDHLQSGATIGGDDSAPAVAWNVWEKREVATQWCAAERSDRGGLVGLLLPLLFMVAGCSDSSESVIAIEQGTIGPALFNDGGHGTAGVAVAGETVTVAQLFLPNHGSSDVKLESIEVLQGEPGLEVVGLALAGEDRTVPVSCTREPGFPPDSERFGPSHPVEGYENGPAERRDDLGPLVLIGVRVPDLPRSLLTGVRITYEYEGRRYQEVFLSTAAFCVDPEMEIGECPLEYGSDAVD
jgi:hypothetical protein